MWAEIYAGIGYFVPLDREAYMPTTTTCFSNPADLPPGTRTRNAAQAPVSATDPGARGPTRCINMTS